MTPEEREVGCVNLPCPLILGIRNYHDVHVIGTISIGTKGRSRECSQLRGRDCRVESGYRNNLYDYAKLSCHGIVIIIICTLQQ